ncbi:tetratricopeptide repeat protein [Portibacter lacus]|uniref:Peptidase M50 domain-containing protein n=1 Tax=Portibacter lacus TaxID=1099794 RepID=A0AA37SR64_9BACT|nr:M50 family metallopeptidase [Portibacter lacus]GLR18412.1 hypothetical protein GCM10007940_30280 [Portibacter lacus]
MEVVLGVVIGIVTIFGIVFSRLLTTFIHELGHSMSALLLTDGPVNMYVGTDRNVQEKKQLKLGRLTIHFSFIIWNLDIGLCAHRESESRIKNIIIILSGPLFSLLLASVLLFLLFQENIDDGIKFILAILMISSFWDFIINLIPSHIAFKLPNGHTVYNDGRQLLELFAKNDLPDLYNEALDEIDAGNYSEALRKLDMLDNDQKQERYFYETKMEIYHLTKDSKAFVKEFEDYISEMNPGLKYVAYWAKAKIRLHAYDEVVEKLTNIIYDGKANYDLYFLRGKALVELSEYNDAMRDFHALTLGKIEDPLALANRAYCQYRLGYQEEAEEDVLQAIEHAKFEQGEIYFFAGVIFEDTDEEKALAFYKKAESLKYDHHALPFNISRIEKFK